MYADVGQTVTDVRRTSKNGENSNYGRPALVKKQADGDVKAREGYRLR